VIGHHIHAADGDIGHVDDLLVDEETWAIRYFVVNTSDWWMGHKVLIAPAWITGIEWSGEHVSVELTRESVKSAPACRELIAPPQTGGRSAGAREAFCEY
jgi:hypothetical protein